MAKNKQVLNETESKKASQLKGTMRSTVKLAAITSRAQTHVDKKKINKAGGRVKHQVRNFGY